MAPVQVLFYNKLFWSVSRLHAIDLEVFGVLNEDPKVTRSFNRGRNFLVKGYQNLDCF